MNNANSSNCLDNAIDDMFEGFARHATGKYAVAFKVWQDKYKPLSHAGRETFNLNNRSERNFVNQTHPRHVWTLYDRTDPNRQPDGDVQQKLRIIPGWFRKDSTKVYITTVPWESSEQGMTVTKSE